MNSKKMLELVKDHRMYKRAMSIVTPKEREIIDAKLEAFCNMFVSDVFVPTVTEMAKEKNDNYKVPDSVTDEHTGEQRPINKSNGNT